MCLTVKIADVRDSLCLPQHHLQQKPERCIQSGLERTLPLILRVPPPHSGSQHSLRTAGHWENTGLEWLGWNLLRHRVCLLFVPTQALWLWASCAGSFYKRTLILRVPGLDFTPMTSQSAAMLLNVYLPSGGTMLHLLLRRGIIKGSSKVESFQETKTTTPK